MAGNIIIDTGAIVALADRREQYHNWCKHQVAALAPPFFTCEAVLSESFHLLKNVPNGTKTLLGYLDKDLFKVRFSYNNRESQVKNILSKYGDLPASFADACLLGMYETTRGSKVFTLDDHFTIYRTSKGQLLSLIIPS